MALLSKKESELSPSLGHASTAKMMKMFTIRQAVNALSAGEIIALPTEAVYGLSCDPMNPVAVFKLLKIKQRALAKGLILISASVKQILPYILLDNKETRAKVLSSWPGPHTWIVSATERVPWWIHGGTYRVAVRVTDHPVVAALCTLSNRPLISTSANPSGKKPAKTPFRVRQYFNGDVAAIIHAKLGGQDRPTSIYDAETFTQIR